ncbi:hypothetical protein BHE97_09105 [Aeromicrobium sp. PE09-221]|uniref:CDGSH iron-sulfur domain-containing protein n=1 Tax=Aeromicrobium sp. PE09-221 TaxID=1898043 RepID=UPI000B3EE1C0|nr:hypothetical protein BHE97_09105 [Aeromicrobium sp. PE09-221]
MIQRPDGSDPDILLCPNGPMIMRGHHVIRTEEGDEVETERPFSAVCRCGGTARPPWCDGTHKVLARGPSRLR